MCLKIYFARLLYEQGETFFEWTSVSVKSPPEVWGCPGVGGWGLKLTGALQYKTAHTLQNCI